MKRDFITMWAARVKAWAAYRARARKDCIPLDELDVREGYLAGFRDGWEAAG